MWCRAEMTGQRLAKCTGRGESMPQSDLLDGIGTVLELMDCEQEPTSGEAAARRRQTRLSKSILECAPLDPACLRGLLDRERIGQVIYAVLKRRQQRGRNVLL